MLFRCDVSKEENLKALVEYAAKTYGGIDVLINCAGFFPNQLPIDYVTAKMFNDMIMTNLISYFAFSKYALSYIRTSPGNIVNIASTTGASRGTRKRRYTAQLREASIP